MPGVESYEKSFSRQSAGGAEWLIDIRRGAFEAFREQGFPTLRQEDWRFTRTKSIQERDFAVVEEYRANGLVDKFEEMTFADAGCHRVVIVDGHFAPDLSRIGTLPAGVTLSSLSEALEKTPDLVQEHLGSCVDVAANPFVALNTAFVREGVFLHLADGVAVEAPFHFAFLTTGTGTVAHPRALVVAGKGAEATVVESWASTGADYFNNAVTEFVCGENASINHCRVQHEDRSAFHVATQQARMGRNARYSTENISLGGALVRNDVGSWLGGEGIDCRMDGLYLAGGRQHVDNHTFIRHAEPHCHSFELYKGILAGKARGVFNGRIQVDIDAQKTDAKQENNCILLSDDARINTNPQLEIFADDVKCTHGATVGQLDENAVFYLRSRGIPAAESRNILIHAFAGEVLERVKVEDLRARLEVELFWWLSKSVTL